MSTNSVYASRKRRKPARRSVKQPSDEGAKSNPSKRHRDRLNGELDLLASLLPFHQDIVSKLDKLTILRLSVGYLRSKSHFSAVLNSNNYNHTASNETNPQIQELPEGELLLQALNGFVLVVTSNGTVFYASSTVKDYLGFHQSDIVHQSVYELVHTEDRTEFCRQLHWALNPSNSPDTGQIVQANQDSQSPARYYNPELLPPENSAFLERNFVCRLRCLLDNSSGFLAMNFQGRLKFLHGQNERTTEGKLIPPQLALFALACPLQPPSILEIRAKNFIFRTKHKLDFTPTACDARGKIVLGYTEAELCYRGSGYQFIHAADMLYCADNHIRMMKTGESGLTVFRLLTKWNGWVWVQANARLIYKNGQPDFIIASQRVLLDEEGEENLNKRSLMLPFSFTTGEAVLYDTNLPMALSSTTSGSDSSLHVAPGDSNQSSPPGGLDPNSLLGLMLKQDESIYVCPTVPNDPQACAQDPEEEEEEEEEDLGGIFSSNWQDSVLSLSGSAFFKKDPVIGSEEEENSSELLRFMASVGIRPEDVQLLQQDELFLNMNARCRFEDLTDEVLSYVQESLRNKVDCEASLEQSSLLSSPQTLTPAPHAPFLFPSQGHESFLLSSCTSQSQQECLPFFVELSEPKIEQFLHTQSPSQHQQLLSLQEPRQYYQGYTQTQSLACKQPSLMQSHELSHVMHEGQMLHSVALQPDGASNPQQQSIYPLNHKHVHQQELSCMAPPQEELYHRLKSMQVNGSSGVSVVDSEQLPPVFQHRLQRTGDLYLETTSLGLELSCRNQVNTVSITCSQEVPSAYVPTGDSRMGEFSTQELEELLHSLDGVGQERHGQSVELQREEWCPWKPAGEL